MYFFLFIVLNYIFFCCSTSASRGKAIDRVPLPPPRYGPATISSPKTSNSSSSHYVPPSFGGVAPVRSAPPLSSVSDAHVNTYFPFSDPRIALILLFILFENWKQNWLVFYLSGAGLSHLHHQCKGYGFWLWTSGNRFGNSITLKLKFINLSEPLPRRNIYIVLSADMLWMWTRSSVVPHMPQLYPN